LKSSSQTNASIEKNKTWFANNEQYEANATSLDTYVKLRSALDRELEGAGRTLDIGNGGVFDYNIDPIEELVALDLFADDIDQSRYPAKVKFVKGTALELPFPDESFDTCVIVMLLHHLVGRTPSDCLANISTCIRECGRALKVGGKLVIVESCVPPWFYAFERKVFQPAAFLAERLITHPMTLQFPSSVVAALIEKHLGNCRETMVPKGKYVLQFGVRTPSFLTPVQPYLFVASRRG
jgi:ubiquinone/menaquinone biosynthesis C-methylase UbiE